jgi:DNA-binding NtrC family response regulator
MVSRNVMVVARDLEIHQVFAIGLAQQGLTTIVASTVAEAEAILSRYPIALVFCADELTSDGIERFLRPSSRWPTSTLVIVVSRRDAWERYLGFLRAGAFDYVFHPPNQDEIERVLHHALNPRHLASLERATSTGQPDCVATTVREDARG